MMTDATVLYMESEELANQWHRLELLHQKADNYLHELDNQKMMTFMAASLVILMLVLAVIVYRYMLQRARIKDEKERMAQQQLNFYTEVTTISSSSLTSSLRVMRRFWAAVTSASSKPM